MTEIFAENIPDGVYGIVALLCNIVVKDGKAQLQLAHSYELKISDPLSRRGWYLETRRDLD